jgi:hypothetical protein
MKQYRNDRAPGLPLMTWIRHHPIASIFGLWVSLVVLAGLSTATLMSIGQEEAPEAEATITALPEEQPVALSPSQAQTRETLPLVSFGAIAVSCTLGCLALSQVVRPVARPQRLPSAAAAQTESAESTSAVVVPTEQDHPLDWDEPSLADSLDLRQRRPLSHWL